MRRWLLFLVVPLAAVLAGEAWLHACGAKFLVSSRGARYQRVLASIQPTRILWYYEDDEDAPEDERWNPDTEKWLNQIGHSLETVTDADAFLSAANQGDFDVMLIHIEDARELENQIVRLDTQAALLPILEFPTRSEYSAARKEYGIVMKFPTTSPKFLAAVEKARRSAGP